MRGTGTVREDGLGLYAAMSRLPLVGGSYRAKVLLAAFLGTHVPLLALAAHLARSSGIGRAAALRVLAVGLLATLGGAAATLYALRALLAPVSLASAALRRYLESRELPELPTGHGDQAGRLIADVRDVAERLEGSLRSLERQAVIDPLTGCYNRRAGERRLAEDLARAGRGGGSLELALVDLDGLKAANDRRGHRAGDACLRRMAGSLARNARAGDWFARWGGDEFLVVCSWDGEHDASDGASDAERLLGRVAGELRPSPARPAEDGGEAGEEEVRVTFSAGVARHRGEEGEGAEGLLARADEALYRAKRQGGNRAVRAP
jgi:diguanylate cyclase (GGDEF)-like protein